MKPVTVRLIVISVVLILEIVLIVVNIPVLSLIAGIVLLGVVLFFLGRMISANRAGKNAIMEPGGGKPDVRNAPASGEKSIPAKAPPVKSGIFTGAGGKLKSLFSRRSKKEKKDDIPGSKPAAKQTKAGRKPPADPVIRGGGGKPSPGAITSAAPASRFETFAAIGKGLKLLFPKRSRKGGKDSPDSQGSPSGSRKGKKGTGQPESLSSVTAEAVSPVGAKREPSPFSPLEQNMLLNADLIPDSRKGAGNDDADPILSDSDLDSLEIFPHDADISRMDLSLDDEAAQITIDDEQDDEVAQILEAHHEELKTPPPEGEPSFDSSLAGLDNLDLEGGLDNLDLGDFNPEGDAVEPAPPPTSMPTEERSEKKPTSPSRSATASSQKTSIERNVANENMLSFSSGPTGDDDLMSSLKTDISGTKRKVNESLVRDLKDTKVQSSEIEKEITELRQLLGRPKKP